MDNVPVDIHFAKMEEWLVDRRAVLGKKHSADFNFLLASAATLTNSVKFDIPAVRKQLQKQETVVADCASRTEDLLKSVAETKKQLRERLADYGIQCDEGDQQYNVDDRAIDVMLAAKVPPMIASHITACHRLVEPLRYFVAVTDVLCKRDCAAANGEPRLTAAEEAVLRDHFPLLVSTLNMDPAVVEADIYKRLNTGLAAAVVEETTDDGPVPEIQWDLGDDGGFTIGGDEAGEAAATDEGAPAIDWGDLGGGAAGVVVEAVGADDNLETEATRMKLADELAAIEAFLRERQREADDGALRTSQLGAVAARMNLPVVEDSRVAAFISAVINARKVVLDKLVMSTLALHEVPNARTKFIASVEKLKNKIHKNETQVVMLAAQSEAAGEEAARLRPEEAALVGKTRELRTKCEEVLRGMFKPRQVYITGEVNML